MHKYALLIGIDDYADTTIRRLECAQHDAIHMAHALGELCGFETIELCGRDAALAAVVDAFAALGGKVAADDIFLFFFAGHGCEHSEKGHLLLMHEARRLSLGSMPTGVLPVREFQRLLADLPCPRLYFGIGSIGAACSWNGFFMRLAAA